MSWGWLRTTTRWEGRGGRGEVGCYFSEKASNCHVLRWCSRFCCRQIGFTAPSFLQRVGRTWQATERVRLRTGRSWSQPVDVIAFMSAVKRPQSSAPPLAPCATDWMSCSEEEWVARRDNSEPPRSTSRQTLPRALPIAMMSQVLLPCSGAGCDGSGPQQPVS